MTEQQKPKITRQQLERANEGLAFQAQILSGMIILVAMVAGDEVPDENVMAWGQSASAMLNRMTNTIGLFSRKLREHEHLQNQRRDPGVPRDPNGDRGDGQAS
jgi:hypothetical protein